MKTFLKRLWGVLMLLMTGFGQLMAFDSWMRHGWTTDILQINFGTLCFLIGITVVFWLLTTFDE